MVSITVSASLTVGLFTQQTHDKKYSSMQECSALGNTAVAVTKLNPLMQ